LSPRGDRISLNLFYLEFNAPVVDDVVYGHRDRGTGVERVREFVLVDQCTYMYYISVCVRTVIKKYYNFSNFN